MCVHLHTHVIMSVGVLSHVYFSKVLQGLMIFPVSSTVQLYNLVYNNAE